MIDYLVHVCENQGDPYCFISYSHKDMDKVLPILKEITEHGCRIWYDRQIQSGTVWANYIYEWLTHKNCRSFIVFISKNSIASENVQDEVHIAQKYKKKLLVVYLEDIELSGGLELHLDRWQSVKWFDKEYDVFVQELLCGIPIEARSAPKQVLFKNNIDKTSTSQIGIIYYYRKNVIEQICEQEWLSISPTTKNREIILKILNSSRRIDDSSFIGKKDEIYCYSGVAKLKRKYDRKIKRWSIIVTFTLG